MLDISPPDLSPGEWQGVRQALAALAGTHCIEPASPESLRDRVGRIVDALAGRAPHRNPLSPRQRALREFLCESGRTRRIAEDLVPTLGDHGFTRAQIEAMALLGA